MREASRSYWWYRFGSQYLFILVPVLVYLGYRIMTDDIAWFIWVIGVGALYYSAQMIFAYFLYSNGQIRWFQSLKNPECILEFNEEALLIKSDNDTSGIEWKSIYDIRIYKNSWVLVLPPYMLNYSVLPIGGLAQDTKSFITSKVSSVLFRSDQGWKIRARLAFSYLGYVFYSRTLGLQTAIGAVCHLLLFYWGNLCSHLANYVVCYPVSKMREELGYKSG